MTYELELHESIEIQHFGPQENLESFVDFQLIVLKIDNKNFVFTYQLNNIFSIRSHDSNRTLQLYLLKYLEYQASVFGIDLHWSNT